MNRTTWGAVIGVAVVAFLLGRASAATDLQWPPRYSEGTGLAVNCSAYVEVSVRGYRSGEYKADAVMDGLSRNCGALGHLWTSK